MEHDIPPEAIPVLRAVGALLILHGAQRRKDVTACAIPVQVAGALELVDEILVQTGLLDASQAARMPT